MIRRLLEYVTYVFTPSPEHRRRVDLEIARAGLSYSTYQREHYEAQERLYRARIDRLQQEMEEQGDSQKNESWPSLSDAIQEQPSQP